MIPTEPRDFASMLLLALMQKIKAEHGVITKLGSGTCPQFKCQVTTMVMARMDNTKFLAQVTLRDSDQTCLEEVEAMRMGWEDLKALVDMTPQQRDAYLSALHAEGEDAIH